MRLQIKGKSPQIQRKSLSRLKQERQVAIFGQTASCPNPLYSKTLFKVLTSNFSRFRGKPHSRLQQDPGLLHFLQQHSWPAAVCSTVTCTALRNFECLLRPVSFSDLQVKRHGRRLRPGIASTHVHHTSTFVS